MRSVVVTGVSTGIGWGATKVLIAKGFRVFGSVRNAADAERLRGEFGDEKFVPLIFDVTDEVGARQAAETVRTALNGETLAGLVNNAGIAVSGPLLYVSVDDVRRQFEVNLVGVLIATQAFAPLLGADPALKGPRGRIVNISSVGGLNASPFMGPYSASKFGLEGLSESLRRELILLGIDVIVIGPGAVATAIWGKAEAEDVSRYGNTPYAGSLAKVRDYMLSMGGKGLKPEKLGEAIHHALTTEKPKTRYAVSPSPIQDWVTRTLPKRTVDGIIAGRLWLLPK